MGSSAKGTATDNAKSDKKNNKGAEKSKPASVKKTSGLKNMITWFEIPAHDFERAVAFYNSVYDVNMETSEVNGYAMAMLPAQKGINGAIICGEGSVPSATGPLLYLNAFDKLDVLLERIEQAGGQILLGRTFINESAGSFALFLDSEGNKLALHEK